ncbi:MAG: hypothetical protein FWG12_07585 [Holophagaceae bacterium]|nr:hypothetical protein [Holophagaceae bacterium]
MRALALFIYCILLFAAFAGGYWLGCPKNLELRAENLVTELRAESLELSKNAERAEATAVKSRPKVKAAEEALEISTETRIASGFSINDLPEPFIAEFEALKELTIIQAAQLQLETQRGDAWRDAALAQRELASLVLEQQWRLANEAKRKGFAWGMGAGAILALAVLL